MGVQFIRHQKYSQIKIYSELTHVYAFGFIVFEIITCEKTFKNFNMFQYRKFFSHVIIFKKLKKSLSKDIDQISKKMFLKLIKN